jgi:hypothetical protein
VTGVTRNLEGLLIAPLVTQPTAMQAMEMEIRTDSCWDLLQIPKSYVQVAALLIAKNVLTSHIVDGV